MKLYLPTLVLFLTTLILIGVVADHFKGNYGGQIVTVSLGLSALVVQVVLKRVKL